MIKPETSDFFGSELDKAKLEIASYWKDKYERTRKALDVAIKLAEEMLESIEDEGMCSEYYEDRLNQIKTALEQKDVK